MVAGQRGRFAKSFNEFIQTREGIKNVLDQYGTSPATTFLTEAVDISDAMAHCIRNFPKKQANTWTKASQDSLDHLSASALGSLLGHFELYQRFVFAKLFEITRFIPGFNPQSCAKSFKDLDLNLNLVNLIAYRGQPAPVGQQIADNLPGWHNPSQVNQYIKSLLENVNFYSNYEIRELGILWQLRHSIVHTGSWLTRSDAAKIPELKMFSDKPIFLKENFIETVVRRMHVIVQRSITRVEKVLEKKIPGKLDDYKEIKEFLDVQSPRKAWLS